jgi:hypothetical protein
MQRNTNDSCWNLITVADQDDFLNDIITLSATESNCEGTVIRDQQESHCKTNEGTDRSMEKQFPGMQKCVTV